MKEKINLAFSKTETKTERLKREIIHWIWFLCGREDLWLNLHFKEEKYGETYSNYQKFKWFLGWH